MRAVNLLPSDLRGAAPKPARASRPEPAAGIGAYVVLGVLALCVAALAGYVLVGNGVKQRQADLDAAQQRTAAATAKATALKPYADFESLAKARVETVRGLAAARFDWEQALRDLSRAVPGVVKLQNLRGDMGLPGTSSAGGDPLRGSIQAPAITLTGCAGSQHGVARMLARIRAVDGVTRVALSKSERAATTTAGADGASPCGTRRPPTFSLVVFFERAAAIAALAPATGATAGAVPVPKAVQGSGQAGSTTPPAATGTASGSASGGSAPSSTPATPAGASTTSTTGSTP